MGINMKVFFALSKGLVELSIYTIQAYIEPDPIYIQAEDDETLAWD